MLIGGKYEVCEKELMDIISNMSTEDLYTKNRFSVDSEYEGNGIWYLYKGVCYYGGCDIDGIPFMTEEEALKEGMRLTLMGERPKIGYCKKCCYELDMPYFSVKDRQEIEIE